MHSSEKKQMMKSVINGTFQDTSEARRTRSRTPASGKRKRDGTVGEGRSLSKPPRDQSGISNPEVL